MNNDKLLISYLTLRKAVGILGFILPIALVAGSAIVGNCEEVQSSISNYYHTAMRDIFVGILCAIALFLFTYNGYDKRDKYAAQLGSVCALGVAFFPTSILIPLPTCNILPVMQSQFIGTLHLLFATLFFLNLAYFSLFLFTESKGDMTPEKEKRNLIYRICGIVMVACIVLITVYIFLLEKKLANPAKYDVIFYLETVALWAFAASWLVKGEMFIADK
jgi:magnesium-transporting ATPase (P-type)